MDRALANKTVAELQEMHRRIINDSWDLWKQIGRLNDQFAHFNIERGQIEALIQIKEDSGRQEIPGS